jgi:type I restriction enzyme S subunit
MTESLPEGWAAAKLADIADIRLGKMLSPKAKASGLRQLPYLRNENVRWGRIDTN